MQGKSFEPAKEFWNWLPILFQSVCWWILLRNPSLFYDCAILISVAVIYLEPFSRCQSLVQSSNQYNCEKEQTQHGFTYLCPGRSWQFFFQLKLWNEMCEVALISKVVASFFCQRKSAEKKVWTCYFRLHSWKPVYWKLEMVVFNHTVTFV